MLFVVLLMSLISIFIYAYEKDIKQLLITTLNNKLATKLDVRKIDLSFYSTFPYAAVTFHDVVLHGSKPYQDDVVFTAQRLDFKFSIFNLISKDFNVKKIEANQGKIFLRVDAENQINYSVLKSDSLSSGKSMNLSLKSLMFNQYDVVYANAFNQIYYSAFTDQAELRADFGASQYNMKIESKWQVKSLKSNSTVWLQTRPLNIDTEIEINQTEKKISFNQTQIGISKLNFELQGSLGWGETLPINLKISAKEANIKSLLSLLPPEFDQQLDQYTSNGNISFVTHIEGSLQNQLKPTVQVLFDIQNGTLSNKKSNVEMSNIDLNGEYVYANNDSRITLKKFSFKLPNGKATGWLKTGTFKSKQLESHIEAELDLAEINQFMGSQTFKQLKGKLVLNCNLKGKLAQSNKAADWWQAITTTGKFQITQASMQLNEYPVVINQLNLKGTFNRQDLLIQDFELKTAQSNIRLKGSLNGLFPYLFSANGALTLNGELDAPKISLDEWIVDTKTTNLSAKDNENETESKPIKYILTGNVNQLTYKKFQANDLSGTLQHNNSVWLLNNIKCLTMKGRVSLDGQIQRLAEKYQLSCIAILDKIDIKKLFEVCENFGQDVLTDKQINGLVSSKISFNASANNQMEVDENSVSSVADILIEQGELIAFKPLESLSRFVSLDELRNIRFSTLKNTIQIKNKQIVIPSMELSNNALNLTISGIHQFSNMVDYKIKLLLSDVLFNKAKRNKKENDEFGEITDDGLGRSKLLLSMTGSIDNPKFVYDAKGVKKKIQEDVKKDAQTVKQLLNEEFKIWKKKDTLSKPQNTKKQTDKIEVDWE